MVVMFCSTKAIPKEVKKKKTLGTATKVDLTIPASKELLAVAEYVLLFL